MKVRIADIRHKMQAALRSKGFAEDDLDFIIEMYLGGEERGHITHGLASFQVFVKNDQPSLDKPEILKETASLFMIDAKSNSGNIIGRRAADEAIKRARKEIIGTAIIKNMDSWRRPGAVAQYITDRGFLSIVINDGGAAAIAPPGGYGPALGTNPIAYGIPTAENESLVVDMATSKRAWGQIPLANKYGTELPPDAFYNNHGEITLNPKDAYSIMPFGEYKGFALALLIEILCGSLIGMGNMMVTKTMASSFGDKLSERGGFILVIDPRQTSDLDEFKKANTELLNKIKDTPTLKGQKIRIPGEQARVLQADRRRRGFIDIPEELWAEIQEL